MDQPCAKHFWKESFHGRRNNQQLHGRSNSEFTTNNMENYFATFTASFKSENGYHIAKAITPDVPRSPTDFLYGFVHSTSHDQIEADVRYGTIYNNELSVSKNEARAWHEVIVNFWRVMDALSQLDEAHSGAWTSVYDLWKDVVNALLRGYSAGHFASWTIPCLYAAAKYLRTFAIKADDSLQQNGSTGADGHFNDDADGESGRNDKLEDAARQINRIFSLCISDR
ncbi:hypothetical protein MRB53_040348 [Persea americana]|nr:hypothetical protein MRB53_040348 [Persea americana]